MPMGSTVPLTLYEDLKKKFENLSIIYNMYGMSEVTGLISSSLNVQNLGTVAQGVIVKIVDPNTECICDANEVTISRILKKKQIYKLFHIKIISTGWWNNGKNGFLHERLSK